VKLAVFGVVLLALGGILGFSISREVASPSAATNQGAAGPPRVAQRPALSAEEQAYVESLWPIHTQVEVAVERVALGAIFYKSNELEGAELKSRLEQALSDYRAADARLHTLQPPASLQSTHQDYLAAVALFERSAVEMLRLFDDGSEDHLQTAYPWYLDGTNKIRDVGGKFWPDEFPPN
jgi:hypothetical protein